MEKDGLNKPLWLLAELTYACPLQCPYCSNPTDYAKHRDELTTEEWIHVLQEARTLGATQLGFSGGEPLLRKDLEILVAEGKRLGYYSNLITSTIGMDEPRLQALKEAGLDSVQVSIQASYEELSDYIAGRPSFQHKMEMAKCVKKLGYPLVLNFVLHRHNIEEMQKILDLAVSLEANYVELANSQYYGFALHNRDQLLPSREQLETAEAIVKTYRERHKEKITFYYIVPDYYENRPKPCMGGWAKGFLNIAPDGVALPCHSARVIPNVEFPSVRNHSVQWIWEESPLFNLYRGYDWMPAPCRTCPEREKDFGGCRCQALLLTGDAINTDPVCEFSPHHGIILDAIASAQQASLHERLLTFRNPKNSRILTAESNG